jgi:serine/threonine protein kinase
MGRPVPFGKYFLLDRINVGGMAEIFKAKAVGVEGFEKLVAIKKILPSIAEDDEFISMFIDEAKIAVQLSHANIGQVFDLGRIDESYFIAMEYVHGRDMRSVFERLRRRGEIMPMAGACYVMMQVCEGLEYAHRKKDQNGRELNIVHRDVSPQNVLVSYDGDVKIIDFGIAKAANKASKTQAGILKGKFGYMSPEQVRGLPTDRRSDIFAAGIILYELVTGERLFYADTDYETLEKVRNVDILPPSAYNRKVPPLLEQIIMKALAKDPDDRYQYAHELGEDVQRFLVQGAMLYTRRDLGNFMKALYSEELGRESVPPPIPKQSEPPPPPPPPPAPLLMTPVPAPSEPPPPPPPVQPEIPAAGISDPFADSLDMPETTAQIEGLPDVVRDRFSGLDLARDSDASAPPGGAPPPAGDQGAEDERVVTRKETAPAARTGSEATQQEEAQQERFKPERLAAGTIPIDRLPPERTLPGQSGIARSGAARGMAGRDVSGSGVYPQTPTTDVMRFYRPVTEARRKQSFYARHRFAILAIAVLAAAAIVAASFMAQHLAGPPEPATVSVTFMPPDSEVILDGVEVSRSSPYVSWGVKPGRHVITVRREGYAPVELPLDVKPGENISRAVTLEEKHKIYGTIVVETVPSGAVVSIDGRVLAEATPVRINRVLADVEHSLMAEKIGFRPVTAKVKVAENETRTFRMTLGGKPVRLTVKTTPPGAAVFVNGREAGASPRDIEGLDAAAIHGLKLSKTGYETMELSVSFDNGVDKIVDVELEKTPTAKKPAPKPRKKK